MIEPISKRRVSELIVEQLRDQILTGTWKPGEYLPPERELSRAFGVTRVSLREALRTLEKESFIETRHGEGSLVKDFMTTAGLNILQYLLKTDLAPPAILRGALELRVTIGVELCVKAAARAGDSDIQALAAILEDEAGALDDPRALQASDFHFFERLAVAADNLVIKLLLNSIRETYLAHAEVFALLLGDPREVLRSHRHIADAVSSGDETEAARAARSYLAPGLHRFFGEEER